GAGIYASAGIPDFRKPSTGPYSNLRTENLWHQEAAFEMSFFRTKLRPFCILAKFLHPGQPTPTVAHAFISLTQRTRFQHIDALEPFTGVLPEKPAARSRYSRASSTIPHTRLIGQRGTFSPEMFPSVRLVTAWCTGYCII
ncbi:hypothetical protein HOY82DRAFT_479454, partial [Tuber indicum]